MWPPGRNNCPDNKKWKKVVKLESRKGGDTTEYYQERSNRTNKQSQRQQT